MDIQKHRNLRLVLKIFNYFDSCHVCVRMFHMCDWNTSTEHYQESSTAYSWWFLGWAIVLRNIHRALQGKGEVREEWTARHSLNKIAAKKFRYWQAGCGFCDDWTWRSSSRVCAYMERLSGRRDMVNWTEDHLFVSVRVNEHIGGGGCCAGHLMAPLLFANYLFRIIYWQHINLHVVGCVCGGDSHPRGLFRYYFMGGSHNSRQNETFCWWGFDWWLGGESQTKVDQNGVRLGRCQGWKRMMGIYDPFVSHIL